MELEKIDTSTTEGKARVMQLAAEGQQVVKKAYNDRQWIDCPEPSWNWPDVDYAVISEFVEPAEEVWLLLDKAGRILDVTVVEERFTKHTSTGVVRYIRADLAEKSK